MRKITPVLRDSASSIPAGRVYSKMCPSGIENEGKQMTRTQLILTACLAFSAALPASEMARKIEFNRDIRPILSDNCFLCHGPDKNTRKAKMRLDVREDALAKEAFKPGKADESELVRRVFSKDDDEMMPPPESKKKLSDAQKKLLKDWIAQ